MATSKTIVKKQVMNPKTGKVRTIKSSVKATNAQKGSNKGVSLKTDKAKLQYTKLQNDASVKKADIAGKVAVQTGYATQIGSIGKQAFSRSNDPITSSTPGVTQNVNGGLNPSQSSRDEDDDLWID